MNEKIDVKDYTIRKLSEQNSQLQLLVARLEFSVILKQEECEALKEQLEEMIYAGGNEKEEEERGEQD